MTWAEPTHAPLDSIGGLLIREREFFLALLDLPDAAARARYLDGACAGDPARRARLEALLRAHEAVGNFLVNPAVEPPAERATLNPSVGDDPLPVIVADAAATDLTFLAPPQRPGSLGRIGHYEALEVLGRGGFGIVFRAMDEVLQRVVAVKVLAPQMAATSPARKRFLREARSSARVRHENVVQVYAVEEQPLPFLVMEIVPGETLQQRLDHTGPLELPELMEIGRQLAEGLAAAHASGLVHRDVKPANVLLEAGVRVKITDFGLARAADDASMTQSGVVAGTPMFMSPEQVAGGPVDQRADLFSLGSVLYTMATGRPPFRANNTLAVLKRVAEDTPRPITEIIPEVPVWLCELIARLHAKKPEDRFDSAREVADRLAFCQAEMQPGGSLLVPGHPARASATQLAPPRRRFRVLAAAVVALCLVGLGITEGTGVTKVRGTVIRLFSREGTLVVQVDDPGVSVTIDGEDLVIAGAGAKEIRLKPGQYKVRARKDGKPMREELVRVERNGTQIVRISREAPAPTQAGATNGKPADGGSAADWEKSVASLPAGDQVKAVAARLKQRNPVFDGAVTPTIEKGVVTGLKFFTNEVADVSPVRALRGLRTLHCEGNNGPGKLSDLSPLKGLQLRSLDCSHTLVADLAPLREMPLTTLVCRMTQVADLSPLSGLKLTHLECGGSPVTSLAPLRGLKLTKLVIDHLSVSDLSPLAGMPLTVLHCGGSVKIKDLSPLKGMKLTVLNCADTAVTDLSPLKGMPLLEISCSFKPKRDAPVLRAIKTLEVINHQKAADFWHEVDQEGQAG